MKAMRLKTPFPWFGGKSKVADLVWQRFGDVANYVEPFAGSLAVLLLRPHWPWEGSRTETVNDLDCYVANFWRALQHAPDEVAHYADWPVNEADLHARHLWLVNQHEFRERMKTDPDYFDSKIAGWWVWGQCLWIGSGWCRNAGRGVRRKLPQVGGSGRGVHRKLLHVGNAGRGVNRKLPHLGNAGRGVHRKLSHVGDAGRGVRLAAYLGTLAERLDRVRVCCGEWDRVLGPSVTFRHGLTGVLLDPPYGDEKRTHGLYACDSDSVAAKVREWAIENGDNPLLRIALCGYEGEHAMPDSWECVPWKNRGGYGLQGNGNGRKNAARERIWFSPHCLKTDDRSLF